MYKNPTGTVHILSHPAFCVADWFDSDPGGTGDGSPRVQSEVLRVIKPGCYLVDQPGFHEELRKISEETIDREYRASASIPGHYPELVVSMNPIYASSINGVRWLNLENYLLAL